MRIVDRKTLSTMPNGTLFCRYIPDMLNGDWNIITGHNEGYNGDTEPVGFYSVLPVEPFLDNDKDTKPGTERITNWRTTDTCDFDFDEDQLFAVFSKTEIRALITVLQYALSDCGFSLSKFMDTYFYEDYEIDEKEIEECRRLLTQFVDIGVDVGFHSDDHSWAVICIAGKPEYVKFMPLAHKDAKCVLDFLKQFQYSRQVIDSPFAFREMVRDRIFK